MLRRIKAAAIPENAGDSGKQKVFPDSQTFGEIEQLSAQKSPKIGQPPDIAIVQQQSHTHQLLFQR